MTRKQPSRSDAQKGGNIPPQIVADFGRSVFGPHWQVPLAKALRIPEQTLRRWTNDGGPQETLPKMMRILAEHETDIARLRVLLGEYAEADETKPLS